MIYGLQPVREALAAGRPIERILMHRKRGGDPGPIRSDARARGIEVRDVPRDELTKRVGHNRHQGIVAILPAARDRPPATVSSILEFAERAGEPPLVVLLDEIQDPHNLGAVVRSAHALGAHGVVIPKRRAVGVTPAVVKVSAGAAEHVLIATVTNLKHAISELQKAGVWCAAAVLEGDPAESTRLDGPLAVVIGSEHDGVRPSVVAACDIRVRIPLSRGFDSLNASVAGGILLYEVARQRRALAAKL